MNPVRRSAERLAVYFAAAVCILFLMIRFLPYVWNYLSPFILAFPIASMLQRPIRFLKKKLHFPEPVSVLIPVLLIFLIVLALFGWFVSFGVNQITYLASHAPEIIAQATDMVTAALDRVLGLFESLKLGGVGQLSSVFNSASKWLTDQVPVWTRSLVSSTVNTASSVPFMLFYLNFFVFAIYFIAKDYDTIVARLRSGVLADPNSSTSQLANSAVLGFAGWLKMQLTYALLSLVVGSVYWTAFGYRYAILISIAAAILEFLPVVGNGTIYMPWAIIALLVGRTASGIQALVLFYGLLLIRRLTEPRLLSHNTGVSPLMSLACMYAGLQFGGMPGLIGGPVIATVITALWHGELRTTMVSDAKVIMRYLHTRWNQPSVEEENAPEPEAADSMEPIPAETSAEEEKGNANGDSGSENR